MAQVTKISKKNVLLIASASLFMLGVIFFSLAIQKYQVLTSSRATDLSCQGHTAGDSWCEGNTRLKCKTDGSGLETIDQIWCDGSGDIMECNGVATVKTDCNDLGCTGTTCNQAGGGGGGGTPGQCANPAINSDETVCTTLCGKTVGTSDRCNATGGVACGDGCAYYDGNNTNCGTCGGTNVGSWEGLCYKGTGTGRVDIHTKSETDTSCPLSNYTGSVTLANGECHTMGSCEQADSDGGGGVCVDTGCGETGGGGDNPCPYSNIDTQFRTGTEPWVNGATITEKNLKANDVVQINCFVNTGSAGLNPADIIINGTVVKINSPESGTNYTITAGGLHTVICRDSQNRANCSNTDSFTVTVASTPIPSPTITVTPSSTPTGTLVPTQTPTATPINTPTTTPTNTPTSTPTSTPTKTATPVPTNTLVPTATVVPTATNTPAPTRTNTPVPPTPTTVVIVQAPISTPTPVTKLTVNDQPPGITPWTLILVPIGLLILGLLL